MPIPAVDNAHVTEGQALLTGRFKNAAVTKGFVTALMQRFQEKENDFWSLLDGVQLANHPMGGGPWDVLDKLAALVGVPGGRLGRSDADLVQAIKIQIRINRSHGLAEDIIQIAALVTAGATYYEWYPAAFEIDLSSTTSSIVKALLAYLGKARSVATAGTIRYSLDAGPWVRWGSSHGGAAGAGFASTYGGAAADELAALGTI